LHGGKQVSELNYVLWDELLNKKQLSAITKHLKQEGKYDDFADKLKGNYKRAFVPIYSQLKRIFGSDIEASLFLKRAGFDGIKYPVGTLTGETDTKKSNYVIFDESAIAKKETVRFSKKPVSKNTQGDDPSKYTRDPDTHIAMIILTKKLSKLK
jgi:hypothetical protein